jgi:hypothetical protein
LNKNKCLSLLLIFCFSIRAEANCPDPQTISYQCQEVKGRKMCTWSPDNGWYQGNTDEHPVKNGERLASNAFHLAIWYPYLDENHGATRCLYVGPYGEKVNLFQQTGYGSVPPPIGTLWTDSFMEGFPGALECSTSASACKFKFGET